jgi:glyoxylase-like metal-dependent hydrolase (beta-lactamase superfamily II)
MKVIQLKKSDKVYSCNSYLILGDWNHIEDLNSVIDPGTDDFVLDEIEHLSTGCGKVAVEQVILTHNHFDHSGGAWPLNGTTTPGSWLSQTVRELTNYSGTASSSRPGMCCSMYFIRRATRPTPYAYMRRWQRRSSPGTHWCGSEPRETFTPRIIWKGW